MHSALEHIKDVLAVIGAGCVTSTIVVMGFIFLSYCRNQRPDKKDQQGS